MDAFAAIVVAPTGTAEGAVAGAEVGACRGS